MQDDFKYAKFSSKSYGLSNTQASTTPTPSTSTKHSRSNVDKSSYKKASTTSSHPTTTSNFKPIASTSSTPTDESVKTSSFKFFTCGGRGHKSFEFTNKRAMILNDDGTYNSMSEGETEALEQVAMHRQVNDEEEQVFYDEDSSPALVVSKVLIVQHRQEEDQRCHIFHTKAGINGKFVKVIIDGGSCRNLASEQLCSKLQFPKMMHPHPYKIQWLSDSGTIQVKHRVQVSFKFRAYEDSLECDVVPTTVCHLLLGRPWQFDRGVIHNGRMNHYIFKMKGKEYVLRPMYPSQVIANKQATHCGENSERVNHQKESECHKPKLSPR